MKIKTFRIHTDVDKLSEDEKAINQFMKSVTVTKTATEFVDDKESYWSIIVYYEPARRETGSEEAGGDRVLQKPVLLKESAKDKLFFPPDTTLNAEEGIVFDTLQKWRNDIAIRTSLPGYMICNKSELVTISKVRPKNLEELGKIKGFSERKLMKYGDDVLALLNSV